MSIQDPGEPRPTPRDRAEGEEQEFAERSAVQRAGESPARSDDDPREEDGWSQPESSAQKGALRDAEEG